MIRKQGHIARLFDNTSECYKLFWFKSIISKVHEGKTELFYSELIDKMIADAWYMVTEYHLNLGQKDTLESVILLMKEKNSSLKSSEKEEVILDYLSKTTDKYKLQYIENVLPPGYLYNSGDFSTLISWNHACKSLCEGIDIQKPIMAIQTKTLF